MKPNIIATIVFAFLLLGCKQASNNTTSVKEGELSISAEDKEQIQNLIRKALYWADAQKSIELRAFIEDRKDSVYIGFDLDKHKQNLEKLRQSNFFAEEFVDNYNQIILTLDKDIREGKYEQWLLGDLPPFNFANDFNPWSMCQDTPHDDSNPYEFLEVNIIDPNKGEVEWKWGNLGLNVHESWKEFSYKFRVVKENGKWKISYLEGFDFKESTRTDGEL